MKETDIFPPEKRSEIMSLVGHKSTAPELKVRSILHGLGFRFRLHSRKLPGTPDIVLPKYKTIIFVNGCFWHHHKCCKRAVIPKKNRGFWIDKFERNTARDQKVEKELEELGWKVIVVWECELSSGGSDSFWQKINSIRGSRSD